MNIVYFKSRQSYCAVVKFQIVPQSLLVDTVTEINLNNTDNNKPLLPYLTIKPFDKPNLTIEIKYKSAATVANHISKSIFKNHNKAPFEVLI